MALFDGVVRIVFVYGTYCIDCSVFLVIHRHPISIVFLPYLVLDVE